ncbi:DNA polymerase beta superfamily protein [Streptomyces sp. NPDC060198]|uniref:nucleotidyltransferase domain-containing protein n=1 Tax=Streptomyces sp. NPDC060198 TaxID=3347070 RepID=UPI003668B21B
MNSAIGGTEAVPTDEARAKRINARRTCTIRTGTAGLPDVDLGAVVDEEPGLLVFATVSGAHLYGFPSRDSDVDLRGIHVLPARDLVGLREPEETRSRMWVRDGVETDLVTHDLRKFVRLMLRPNGYVLEQLLSPLVVRTSPLHQDLIDLAPGVMTRHHADHYRGFARTQWRLFEKNGELKPLLYTFRALLTGVHAMRTGVIEAHLPTLLDVVEAPKWLPALIEAKAVAEHGAVEGPDRDAVAREVATLDTAQEETRLGERPAVFEALHELVVRARLGERPQVVRPGSAPARPGRPAG